MRDGRKDLTVNPEHRQGTPEARVFQGPTLLLFFEVLKLCIGGHPHGRSALRRSSVGYSRQHDRRWDWILVVGGEHWRPREDPRGRGATRASPNLGFGLVADEIINIGEGLLELNAEKVSNEGSRGAEDEDLENSPCEVTSGSHLGNSSYLPLPRSLLAEFWDRVGTVSQEVALDVKYLGSIYEGGGGLQ